MSSKPHLKSCEGKIFGLSDARAYALACPHCSLGPPLLAHIEMHRRLARVVRANLALRDPKIVSHLLVILHVKNGRKMLLMRKIRNADKLIEIKLDTRVAGNELYTSPARSAAIPEAWVSREPRGAEASCLA